MINREMAKNCVGPGWSCLIDSVYDRLPQDANVTTVKEKFGGLRIYIDGIDDEFQDFVLSVEDQSIVICEMCGKPGILIPCGWWKTLCDDCRNRETK